MPDSFRFPYVPVSTAFSSGFMRPLMPVTLERSGRLIQSNALLDTGADVNVMPYTLGLALGGDWLNQMVTPPLILGQLNFFDAFNVCFFRGEGYFEVTPRL